MTDQPDARSSTTKPTRPRPSINKGRTEAEVPLQAIDEMALQRDSIEFVQTFLQDSDRKRRTGTNAGGQPCLLSREEALTGTRNREESQHLHASARMQQKVDCI
jgi:hypothetical protein